MQMKHRLPRCQKIALGSSSVTLDSRQTVHFPPVEGRAVSARIGSNGPIRVEDKTTLLMAVGYDLLTSISGKPKRRILSQIFVLHK